MRVPPARNGGAPGERLALVAAVGLAGSLAVAWSAYAVGVRPGGVARPPWPGEGLLHDTIGLPSPTAGRWLWYGGVLTLALAWLALVRVVAGDGGGARRLGTVTATVVLWAAPLLVCPPVGSRDVYSYLAHGELAAAGLDPGEVTPREGLAPGSRPLLDVDRTWRTVVSAYGPLATGLSEVAVRVTDHDVPGAVLVERLWAAAGVALLAGALVALARDGPRSPALVLAVAVASPIVLVHVIGGAHNEGLMVGLAAAGAAVAAATAAHPDRRRVWAGWAAGVVLVGLGAAVKVSILLVAAYLGWCAPGLGREVRPVARRVVYGAAAGVLALATIGLVGRVVGVGWGWVGGAGAGGKVLTLLSVPGSLGALLADPFTDSVRELQRSAIYTGVRVLGVVASVVLAATLLWRSPRLGLDAVGWALLAVAVLGPAVHPWYLVWGLPFLALRPQGRAEPWLLGASVLAALSTKPAGGGAWPNLGLQPWRLLLVAAAVAVGWAAWRRFGFSPAPVPRTAAAPAADPTPASS